MDARRKKIVNGKMVEEFLWNGDLLIYVDHHKTEGTFDEVCEGLHDVVMKDRATIEIDWDNKIVGVSQQPLNLGAREDTIVETSYSQIIAMLASKYAYDLIQLSPEELRKRHIDMLSGRHELTP